MTRRRLLTALTLGFLLQPGCFLKFWGKDDKKEKPKKEKVYDIYGTVEEVTRESLRIRAKRGPLEFVFVDSSRKGSDFQPGATVHVFYKQKDGQNQITLVVEKIK